MEKIPLPPIEIFLIVTAELFNLNVDALESLCLCLNSNRLNWQQKYPMPTILGSELVSTTHLDDQTIQSLANNWSRYRVKLSNTQIYPRWQALLTWEVVDIAIPSKHI